MKRIYRKVPIYSKSFGHLFGGFCTLILDKAKPSVKRGRKAAGLIKSKMAELPKDAPAVGSAFFLASVSSDSFVVSC